MAWDLSNYEQVDERIDKFYTSHNDGRILTEIHTLSDDKVVFKALVYVGEILVSTGFAYEKEGSTPVNKTSYIENCETSAIGRALANYNFAKKGARPSKEEMEKVVRYSAPKPAPEARVTTENTGVYTDMCEDCGDKIPTAVVVYSKSKFGKKICRKCQDLRK